MGKSFLQKCTISFWILKPLKVINIEVFYNEKYLVTLNSSVLNIIFVILISCTN